MAKQKKRRTNDRPVDQNFSLNDRVLHNQSDRYIDPFITQLNNLKS